MRRLLAYHVWASPSATAEKDPGLHPTYLLEISASFRWEMSVDGFQLELNLKVTPNIRKFARRFLSEANS